MKRLITELCKAYNIGHPISELQPYTGGLLHQIYRIETTKGQFVIKLLNPTIINSHDCKDRFRTTENIARESAKYIPAVSALTHQDDPLFTFENSTVMLFPYIDGQLISQHEITTYHTEQICHG